MTDISQNFSLIAGDDTVVEFDIGPDTTGLDLSAAQQLNWNAYPQIRGVPDKTAAVISKQKGDINIEDPTALIFKVPLASAETIVLSGSYYYEITIVDIAGKRQTPTIGLMTVIDTTDPYNVASFKMRFPEFSDTDDSILQSAIDEATLYVDETWTDDQVTGTLYLAAHFASLAQQALMGESGDQIVTSEKIGQISVTYAAVAGKAAGASVLGTTPYGLLFQNLLGRQGGGIAVV